jgi:hypothetical protein
MIVSFAVAGKTSGLWPGMAGEEADRLLGGETGLVPLATADGQTGCKGGGLEAP